MRRKLPVVSKEEQDARRPPPPEILCGAIEDSIPSSKVGKVRVGKSIKFRGGKR